MDKSPGKRPSALVETGITKNAFNRSQTMTQTLVNCSPKKRNPSLNSKLTNASSVSPRRVKNTAVADQPKPLPSSPRKLVQRYRPVAEDKIQTDIVNAIVARDAEATMKKNKIKAKQGDCKSTGQSIRYSKGLHHASSSPKKQLPKRSTRGQAQLTNKKESENGTMSPRKSQKKLRRPPVLCLPREKMQSSLTKPLSVTESFDESLETKEDEAKMADENEKISDDVNKSELAECPKSDTKEEPETVSSDLNANNTMERKLKRSIKPPGPLVKRSPFKNNPKFNRKHGHVDLKIADVDKVVK